MKLIKYLLKIITELHYIDQLYFNTQFVQGNGHEIKKRLSMAWCWIR